MTVETSFDAVLRGYLLAALFPLIYTSLPNPVALYWLLAHGAAAMPLTIQRRALVVNGIIPYVQLLLVAATTTLAQPVAILVNATVQIVLVGVLAGVVWLTCYAILLRVLHLSRERLSQHQFTQRSLAFWLPLTLLAAVVEELWRAACLVSLAPMGVVWSIVLAASAFGLGHLPPLGRGVSATGFGLYLGTLYLWTGSLLSSVIAHAFLNIGTLTLVRLAYQRSQPHR